MLHASDMATPIRIKLTLTDYPNAMVHIACPKCGRSGRLSKARLIAEHGAAIPLPDLRHVLAASPRCGPHVRSLRGGVSGFGEMKSDPNTSALTF
jgi:hypothetical protein